MTYFPQVIWRLICEYAVPYRSYWMRRMSKNLQKIDANKTATLCAESYGDQLNSIRRCQIMWEGLNDLESERFLGHCAHIRCLGMNWFHNGCTYYRCYLVYPDGIYGHSLTPAQVRDGRRSHEVRRPLQIDCYSNY